LTSNRGTERIAIRVEDNISLLGVNDNSNGTWTVGRGFGLLPRN
jgi:hypothetical protein